MKSLDKIIDITLILIGYGLGERVPQIIIVTDHNLSIYFNGYLLHAMGKRAYIQVLGEELIVHASLQWPKYV